MLAAAVGLIAFSIFTLAAATGDDIPGDPLYFVLRQIVYALIGIALMFAVARVDYSRFRELRVGIYSAMIATITLVLLFGAAARGSRRWIELPYFRFQPSELAKVLLIVSLAAFVIERTRRGARPAPDRPPARASGWCRPHSSSSNPTSARESCSWSLPRGSLPRRGALDALRGDRGGRGGGRDPRSGRRSGGRGADPAGLSAGAAHKLSEPE